MMPSAPSPHADYRLLPASDRYVRATVISYRLGAITRESAIERVAEMTGISHKAAEELIDG